VLIPSDSRKDLAELSAELVDKLKIDLYIEPVKVALKASANM
jgi:predicted ATP-dependent Lon-type protease